MRRDHDKSSCVSKGRQAQVVLRSTGDVGIQLTILCWARTSLRTLVYKYKLEARTMTIAHDSFETMTPSLIQVFSYSVRPIIQLCAESTAWLRGVV